MLIDVQVIGLEFIVGAVDIPLERSLYCDNCILLGTLMQGQASWMMLELDTTIIIRLGFSLFEWSSNNSKCKLKSLGNFITITIVKCLLNFAKNVIYIVNGRFGKDLGTGKKT